MLVLLFLSNISIQIDASGISSLINLFIHIPLYTLFPSPMYLVFVIEFDTMRCFLLFHITMALFIK